MAAFAFDNPARQSMIPRIVPLPFLPSAIGMQSAAFNGASVIGPLIAGLLYLPIGIPGLFATNAISFAAIIGALIAMRPVPPIALGATRSLFASVVEGARYVRRNPTLAWVLTIAGTVFVTAGPTGALLPALTGEALWNGMSWLAALLTAMGLGAFLAALCVMNVARVRGLGRIFIAAGIANGAGLVAFALTVSPVVSLLLAFVTGFSGTLMAGMGNNILQATTADAYRGRVMSLWGFLFIGLMPVGQLALGTIGTLLGINAALFIGGAIALTAAVYGARRVPAVAAWRAPVPARVEVEPDLSASAAVTTLK